MDRDRLKTELVNHLRQNPSTQFENVMAGIEQQTGEQLTQADTRLLLEIVHEFIASNIIMTALDRYNTGWPWLRVTSHGQQVLGEEGPPVYDYDGYLAELRRAVPNLDSVVERYVGESLQAYQRNVYLASMVMLGCASERAIVLLMNAYTSPIDNEQNRERLRQRIANRDISHAYSKFRESFDTNRHQISDTNLDRDFDAHVDGIFNFIRLLRNSIVHPTAIPNITNAIVYANLQQFAYYARTIFGLVQYFENNRITV